MRINSWSEFIIFIKNNNLTTIAPELPALDICATQFLALCECDTIDVKNAKQNQCKSIYIGFLSGIHNYKKSILSKCNDKSISFYSDGNLIVNINK